MGRHNLNWPRKVEELQSSATLGRENSLVWGFTERERERERERVLVAEKEINQARLGLCLRQLKTGLLANRNSCQFFGFKKKGFANGYWVGPLSYLDGF